MTLPSSSSYLDAFFESYYRLRPVNATFTGVHDYDDTLPDWSEKGLRAASEEMRILRRRLVGQALLGSRTTNGSTTEHDVSDIDGQLARAFLDIQLAELQGEHFQRGNPSLFAGEAAFSVIALMTRDFAPVERRMDSAVARMDAIPRFLDGAREVIHSAPTEWAARAQRECEGGIELVGASMDEWLRASGADATRAERVRAAARGARAAFERFRDWCSSLPPRATGYACGAEFYDLLLRHGHWCTRSRDDLLAEARESLASARAQLDAEARAVAAGGWPAVQERLAALHPTLEGYLAHFDKTWRACRRVAEERDLVTWPEYPIRYVPIPTFTRAAAPALYYLFYRSPAPFDQLPVHDYVVPPLEPTMPAAQQEQILRATNDSVIKLNHVVHHGAIGHHVQNYRAYHGPSRIGQVAAVDGASRIGMFCGGTLAEGWACYATDLMAEVGFLSDLELVAEQHTRVRMLCRAVVDIELHQGTMPFDEAVAFYETRASMPPPAARAEVVKNSMFPGTAIMYWLGTQAIHALRAERAAAEGQAFSLRAFHDELLGYGAIPVPLIAQLMMPAEAA